MGLLTELCKFVAQTIIDVFEIPIDTDDLDDLFGSDSDSSDDSSDDLFGSDSDSSDDSGNNNSGPYTTDVVPTNNTSENSAKSSHSAVEESHNHAAHKIIRCSAKNRAFGKGKNQACWVFRCGCQSFYGNPSQLCQNCQHPYCKHY